MDTPKICCPHCRPVSINRPDLLNLVESVLESTATLKNAGKVIDFLTKERAAMSELTESIEKSVAFLKEKYPADLPLLLSLEATLKRLTAKKESVKESSPPSNVSPY